MNQGRTLFLASRAAGAVRRAGGTWLQFGMLQQQQQQQRGCSSFFRVSLRMFATSKAGAGKKAAAAAAASASKPLFDKILVANRGEIACRVLSTARKLGIKTVAVYSEPDVMSKHVRMADEAVCVGPAESAQSYLRMDAILEACKETGAQAVHPGYGFLSENTEFCDLLEKNGVTFIGPKPKAIHLMGDKIESKEFAKNAGVNIIPGFIGKIRDASHAVEIANEIGYPVMIKASAGGGGKGMRIAWNDQEARDGFRYSKDEAKKSFGNDTIFVEKFIEDPRHVEIQVLLDHNGNGVYLNERECSIQRRNQKVIEEAPCVALTPEVRKQMGEQAVQLARAVEYESAGTVEFLLDKHKNFYFLEMNTRLQVEHPITEYITGVDIVEQMIKIAAGNQLAFTQDDVGINGWAVEARVYAEDPLRNFLPSIGTLNKYVEPPSQNHDPADVRKDVQSDVRCDSGVLEGSEISMFYDPLICKLVVHGANREEALRKTCKALDSYIIRGVNHNISFLRAVLDHGRFKGGDISTKFIEEEYPDGFQGVQMNDKQKHALIASTVHVHLAKLLKDASVSNKLSSFDPHTALGPKFEDLLIDLTPEDRYSVQVAAAHGEEGGELALQVHITKVGAENEAPVVVEVESDYVFGQTLCPTVVDGEEYMLQLFKSGAYQYSLQHCGSLFDVKVRTPAEDALLQIMPVKEVLDLTRLLISPMPGAVASVSVKPGDKVLVGEELCVVEAMKMQNALRAERDAVVKEVHVAAGDTVSTDEILIEFE